MSRPGSAMVAGYYPAPVKIVRAIGALIRPDDNGLRSQSHALNIVDPCAGNGEAIVELTKTIVRTSPAMKAPPRVFGCELEAGRAAALEVRLRRSVSYGYPIYGDAFRLLWEGTGSHDSATLRASVLFLNSPYDTDPEFGRLEERWLRQFTPILNHAGGLLVFLIPVTALAASAETLARSYIGVTCYRFPEPYYAAFKQVVVFARRRYDLPRPDSSVVARVNAWAADPTSIPVLPMDAPATPPFVAVTASGNEIAGRLIVWGRRPLVPKAVALAAKPWRFGGSPAVEAKPGVPAIPARAPRLVPGLLPENGVVGFTSETFDVAFPLREGHVASALAVGVFNGVRVQPDDRASGLPPIFAKATFAREWVTKNVVENDKGEVIREEQIQQPKLIMTALDLKRGKYVEFERSLQRKSSTDLDKMTVADALAAYNAGFMRTLREKCRPTHDPADPNRYKPVFPIARPLYERQAEVAATSMLLIEKHRGALIEGEVGVGKTSMAVAIASALRGRGTFGRKRVGARRIVVTCPPHLLHSWQKNEIAAVMPDARTMIISDIHTADAFGSDKGGGILFGIISETSGKLSYGRHGVGDPSAQPQQLAPGEGALFTSLGQQAHRAAFVEPKKFDVACSKCGALGPVDKEGVPLEPDELAAKQLRCARTVALPMNGPAALVQRMVWLLAPLVPSDEAVTVYGAGRLFTKMLKKWTVEADQPLIQHARWLRTQLGGQVGSLAMELTARILAESTKDGLKAIQAMRDALGRVVAAAADDAVTVSIARSLFTARPTDKQHYGEGHKQRELALDLVLQVADRDLCDGLVAEFKVFSTTHGLADAWPLNFKDKLRVVRGEISLRHNQVVTRKDGAVLCYEVPRGDLRLLRDAFEELRKEATFETSEPCGEPLYAAIPDPRRVPLAERLAKKWGHRIDLVIQDEVHEATNLDSAQTQAMEQFRGRPMLGLTGSISNGYVASMHGVLHTFSPLYRREFERGDIGLLRERYGYQERTIQDVDRETKRPVAFGTKSSRVVRQAKITRDAAGALPSFVLRHFLPIAVPISVEDINIHLPPVHEFVEMIDPGPVLGPRVASFCSQLADQIAADRFTPMQGKLFGAMGEAWSVADRAALGIGNGSDGIYKACYPKKLGGDVVCRLKMMPADELLPKEQRLVEIVNAEVAEGRNVLIFAWHSDCGLYERLAEIVNTHCAGALRERKLAQKTVILDSDKVQATKREQWLLDNVVDIAPVMIVNPAAVETGLNCLTWFNTIIWFQPPASNPKAKRQAEGRVRRPGQTKEQRFYWLLYQNTLQVPTHKLLQLKVAESMSIDGADNTAALRAAGIEPVGGVGGFDLGRELYRATREGIGLR